MNLPIIDLHCDLLAFLAHRPNASFYSTDEIGVALPYLQAGNVKHQILAIFSSTEKGSVEFARKELDAYQFLIKSEHFYPIIKKEDAQQIFTHDKIGVTVAIESLSGLCEEDEPLDLTFQRLEEYLEVCGHLFYISFTHHPENRFGGGNYSDNIGLKDDGKAVLDYLNGRNIAVDFSHSSDNLVHDILNYIDAKSLDIPVMASHSNYRNLCGHVRNLPKELVKEIVKRNGLIGMNFLRAYVHETDPNHLIEHILYGIQEDVSLNQIAFGADFFDIKVLSQMLPDRVPFFFPEHENASKYPIILKELAEKGINQEHLEQLAYQNTLDFINRNWTSEK